MFNVQLFMHSSITNKQAIVPCLTTCCCSGTPITNKQAIAAQHGEIYGLNHNMERFDPLTVAQLR